MKLIKPLFLLFGMSVLHANAQFGEPDNTFGSEGKVTTSIGSSSAVLKDIATQGDRKIVAVGYNGDGLGNFVVVRYNTNGSLDLDFGTGGKVTTDIFGGTD